jgi:hypothetical protein
MSLFLFLFCVFQIMQPLFFLFHICCFFLLFLLLYFLNFYISLLICLQDFLSDNKSF